MRSFISYPENFNKMYDYVCDNLNGIHKTGTILRTCLQNYSGIGQRRLSSATDQLSPPSACSDSKWTQRTVVKIISNPWFHAWSV